MIRYDVSWTAVEQEVDRLDSKWRTHAGELTRKNREAEHLKHADAIWSAVKPVFMTLQKNKCAYCETKLEGEDRGRIQHDVDHFRPKSAVEAWSGVASRYGDTVLGDASPTGYYLLAHHLRNYALACKTCNSILKRARFPVAAKRVLDAAHPVDATAEGAYLIYPIGEDAVNPRTLLTFVGHVVQPVEKDTPAAVRAQIVIDFFDLNREGLKKSRALALTTAWLAFQDGDNPDDFRLPGAPHSACVACFLALCWSDPEAARRLYLVARELIRADFQRTLPDPGVS